MDSITILHNGSLINVQKKTLNQLMNHNILFDINYEKSDKPIKDIVDITDIKDTKTINKNKYIPPHKRI